MLFTLFRFNYIRNGFLCVSYTYIGVRLMLLRHRTHDLRDLRSVGLVDLLSHRNPIPKNGGLWANGNRAKTIRLLSTIQWNAIGEANEFFKIKNKPKRRGAGRVELVSDTIGGSREARRERERKRKSNSNASFFNLANYKTVLRDCTFAVPLMVKYDPINFFF